VKHKPLQLRLVPLPTKPPRVPVAITHDLNANLYTLTEVVALLDHAVATRGTCVLLLADGKVLEVVPHAWRFLTLTSGTEKRRMLGAP